MITCTFELNDQPMSELKFGAISFPAFSGMGRDRNRRASMCARNLGPIPVGSYYIIDRIPGGIRGKIYGAAGKILGEKIGHQTGIYQADWFALYAIDSKIDDEMFCDMVRRGEFRLHPASWRKISKGCVTINDVMAWQRVKSILRRAAPIAIPDSSLEAYGRLTVR